MTRVQKHKYYYLKLQPRKAGHAPVYMEITPFILLNQSQNNGISAAASGRKLRYNISLHKLHNRNVLDAF
jgi:hypothetical protein